MNMGIEPFLVASAIDFIQAQRLIRRICKDCKGENHVPVEALVEIGFSKEEAAQLKTYKGTGCQKCNNTGYKGRVGLYELLVGSDGMKKLIQEHARVADILATSLAEGMLTLKMDGMEKVLQGITDMAQVRAVCIK